MEMTKELKKYIIILFILGCLFIGYVVNSKQYVSGEMIQHVMEMGNIAGMNSGVLKAISEAKTNSERIVFTQYSNYSGTNDIEVSYPKLQEIEGIDVQKINSLIENDLMRIFENNQLYKENNYCLHLKCEVAYFGNNIISIQYKGFDGPGILVKSYYEKALGTTIDMKSEKVLHLEDIIIDFDGLSELLMEDKFEAIEIWAGEEPDKLSVRLQGKDKNTFIEELQTYGSGYIENVEWYTDGSAVVIIYGNLTERYYGEYAGSKELMVGITDPRFWEEMNSELVENKIYEEIGWFGYVPNEKYLEEFVEQVELSLSYEEWFEKSTIPDNYRKNPLEVVVFWKDGDYYFIPADTCNDEIEIDGAPRPVEKNRYQENAWYFYTLRQGKKARLVDEYWYLGWEATLSEKKTKALTYLGEVEIDATGTTMPPVSALEKNEYTDAIIDYLSRCPELPEGDYRVYFGKYEYYPGDSEVWFTGVIEQNGVCRYFMGNICMSEDGSYTARCDHGNGYSEWFPTTEEVPADVGVVEHILEAERLVLDLTIKWDSE